MPVQLNHTIVHASDRERSAAFAYTVLLSTWELARSGCSIWACASASLASSSFPSIPNDAVISRQAPA